MLFTPAKPAAGNSRGTRRNVAVIGGGISGMGAAYALCGAHDVTLFESRPRLGGHARTLIAGPGGTEFPVDTGFMVFNYRNYPNLNALFDKLDVPVKKSNMSFAVSLDDGHFEYGLHSVKGLLAKKTNAVNPRFWRMIFDIFKFNKRAHIYKDNPDITLGQVLRELGMSAAFKDRYLCPLAGAIWSTTSHDMLDFPAQSLIRFFDNHGLLSATDNPQWYTVDGGSKVYVDRFEAELRKMGCVIKTGTPVQAVSRHQENGVKIKAVNAEPENFDAVIFACHSDQAMKIITDPTQAERNTIGAIRYKNNEVILHCDPRQMPARKTAWSSWVYKGDSENPGNGSFTYWMNLLQTIPNETPVFVTLNPGRPIDEKYIYNQTQLAHPQFDLAAQRAQTALPGIQGQNNTWFCGAYTRYGFHEDGFASGLKAGHDLHESLSFAKMMSA